MKSFCTFRRQGLIATAMGFALFIALIAPLGATSSQLSFTTQLDVGKTITLSLSAEGTVTATGLKEALICDGMPHAYTIEQQSVVVTGSVLSLQLEDQRISALDIRQAKELKTLFCSKNQLKELYLNRSEQLEVLDCSNNELTKLTLPTNSKLSVLKVNANSITSLSLANCALLEELDFSGNYYPTFIDTSACPKLKVLRVDTNQIRSLKLAGNNKLEVLSANENPINSIDLSMLGNLKELSLANNEKLSSIVWGTHPNLRKIDLFATGITALELSSFTNLEELQCGYCGLTSLDVSHNKQLKILSCGKNPFKGIDVSANTLLEELKCNDLSIKELNLSNNPKLVSLSAHHNALSSLDLSHQTQLSELNVGYNALSELDLSKQSQLKTLIANNNKLQKTALFKNAPLERIELYSNKIPSDVTAQLATLLPDRSALPKGILKIIDTKDTDEGNACTAATVQMARAKNWRIVDYAGFGNQGDGYDYRGNDAPAVGDGQISLIFDEQSQKVTLLTEMLGGINLSGTVESGVTSNEVTEYTLNNKKVVIQGDAFRFAVKGAKLNQITLDKCAYLQSLTLEDVAFDNLQLPALPALYNLTLNNNALKQLTLGAVPELKRISCYGNAFSEAEGNKLIDALPDRSTLTKGVIVWINSDTTTEQDNAATQLLAQKASEKNWTLNDYKGGTYGDDGIAIENFTHAYRPVLIQSLKAHKDGSQWLIETAPLTRVVLFDSLGNRLCSVTSDRLGKAVLSLESYPQGTYLLSSEKGSVQLLHY